MQNPGGGLADAERGICYAAESFENRFFNIGVVAEAEDVVDAFRENAFIV
jgi:hypothetical protein